MLSDSVLSDSVFCHVWIEQEHMRMGEGVLDVLMRACGGDMRKAVGFLQSSHDLSGGGSTLVTADMVHDVSGQVCVCVSVYECVCVCVTVYVCV
jgi:hypothetical protein